MTQFQLADPEDFLEGFLERGFFSPIKQIVMSCNPLHIEFSVTCSPKQPNRDSMDCCSNAARDEAALSADLHGGDREAGME